MNLSSILASNDLSAVPLVSYLLPSSTVHFCIRDPDLEVAPFLFCYCQLLIVVINLLLNLSDSLVNQLSIPSAINKKCKFCDLVAGADFSCVLFFDTGSEEPVFEQNKSPQFLIEHTECHHTPFGLAFSLILISFAEMGTFFRAGYLWKLSYRVERRFNEFRMLST